MTATAWLVVVLGGLITFAERFAFLSVARRAGNIPPRLREALRMIPAAALAALVVPSVFRAGAGGAIDLTNPRILAVGLAMVVMWRIRSVLLTLVVGLGVLIVLQQLT